MSQNPFQTPAYQGVGTSYQGKSSKAPTPLMVILIFSLIIGILGSIGSCVGAGGLVLGTVMVSSLETANAQNPSPEIQSQLRIQQIAQGNFLFNLIFVIGSLILSPLMATGAIACLNRKSWGHSLLTIAFSAGIVFVLVRAVLNTVMQLKMKDVMAGEFQQMAQQQGNNGPPIEGIMSIFMGVGIVFAVVWALIQIGFYLWGFLYLRQEPAKAYLNVK